MKRNSGQALLIAVAVIGIYGMISYFLLPAYWHKVEKRENFKSFLEITTTREGIPGDPLNIGLVGTKDQMFAAFEKINWDPAAPATVKSILRETECILFRRPYPEAPVSNLYLFGRKEDIAFEQHSSASPWRRHHVRLWKSNDNGKDGRPLWVGAATFDLKVGLSLYTGQVTHHINAGIDMERDKIITDMLAAELLTKHFYVMSAGPVFNGVNGEGDRYHTDGQIAVGVVDKNLDDLTE